MVLPPLDVVLTRAERYTGQPDTFVELKTSISINPQNRAHAVRFEKLVIERFPRTFGH